MVLSLDIWVWFPFWVGLGLVFILERVVTVWRGGWSARLLGLALFPELVFAMVLNLIYVKGIVDIVFGRKAGWHHESQAVSRPTRAEALP